MRPKPSSKRKPQTVSKVLTPNTVRQAYLIVSIGLKRVHRIRQLIDRVWDNGHVEKRHEFQGIFVFSWAHDGNIFNNPKVAEDGKDDKYKIYNCENRKHLTEEVIKNIDKKLVISTTSSNHGYYMFKLLISNMYDKKTKTIKYKEEGRNKDMCTDNNMLLKGTPHRRTQTICTSRRREGLTFFRASLPVVLFYFCSLGRCALVVANKWP